MPRLISRKQLLEIVPLSYPAIWKRMKEGTFPRSRAIGTKPVWFLDEVVAWINALSVVESKGGKGEDAA